MTPPKKIYIHPTMGDGLARTWFDFPVTEDSVLYFSEEYIRAIANELYNNGDAFIAKLNGKSFSEYLKED